MKTFKKADASVYAVLTEVVGEIHPELKSVKFDVLEVSRIDGGPALTHGGYPCDATVRILSLKDRTAGRGDAEIVVDATKYAAANPRERKALLDHEVTHLQLKKDKKGLPVNDALGRPRLVRRLHDWQFGWFNDVALRWGTDSGEVKQATELSRLTGQMYFGFVQSGQESTPTAPTEPEDEEIIDECLEVIRATQKASVAILQRRLRIGYTRASRIMDILEERGVVGPHKNNGEPRDILKLPEAA